MDMKKKANNNVYKSDYSKENLPKTRREQFWRLLKDNFFTLMKLGLILLVLMIPFLTAIVMKNVNLSYVYNNADLSEIDKTRNIASINIIFSAIYIPCIMLFFLGLGGILKVLRRLIWDEPLFFKEDFFLGIKENIGQFLLFGFLIGFITFLNVLAYQSTYGWAKYLSYVMIGVSFALIIPIIVTAGYISSIYKNKISVSFSVSMKLFIRRGIFIILILLFLYSTYFLSWLKISVIIYLAILFVLIILLFPVWLLISFMNCIKNLDDYVNVYYYPENAYLGLFVANKQQNRKEQ